MEQLKDRREAAEYLTACFEDSKEVFLLGLRNVVEAYGGIGKLASNTSLNRESLYRMLSVSGEGNPRLSSLAVILDALGIQLQFSSHEAA
jgi:probable addiction module antidote protein